MTSGNPAPPLTVPTDPPPKLSHLDETGSANMVDVSHKPPLKRVASAGCFITLQAETLALLQQAALPKGDVLTVARIAGIQAAKQTAALIPLCHSLPLAHVSLDFAIEADGIRITSQATTVAGTGVEMEALTAASIAALTIYDMCKAVDKSMHIRDLHLLSKQKNVPSTAAPSPG